MEQSASSGERPFTAFLSATEIAKSVSARKVGAEEVILSALADIAALDPKLNCFAAIDPERMIAEAIRLDREIATGEALDSLRLPGVPLPVKDLIATRDLPTSWGSKLLAGAVAGADAPSVARALSDGAILCGKTTTSELGCKATGYSPLSGTTRNPWNAELTPGGSSAGSAAVVAAGIAPVALGTDGGGSVRIPASLTGIFGIKPTFGRVPVHPVSATPTLAHVGILSRTVRDAALVLDIIGGFDPKDPFSVPAPPPACLAGCRTPPRRGTRVAYSPTLGYARPTKGVLAAVEEGVKCLEALGCEVTLLEEIFPDPAEIWESEFYTDVAARIHPALEADNGDLDPDVARKLRDFAARDLLRHRTLSFERFRLRDTVRSLFERFDFLVTPTLPVTAFPVGRAAPDGYPEDALVTWSSYTYPFNLCGQPAVSLPAGFHEGLPVGMQVVADHFGEDRLFGLSAAYEEARPWVGHYPRFI